MVASADDGAVALPIQEQVNLQTLNTLAVPSIAQFYIKAITVEDITLALNWADHRGLPVYILGGGSNVLMPATVQGLVIQVMLRGITIEKKDSEHIYIRVAAGENWHQLVCHSVENRWYGLENLALIPGTVGAAPIQNIGAYGVEVKDYIESVEALDRNTGLTVSVSNRGCQFAYRESIFKKRDKTDSYKSRYIILSVRFKLRREPKVNISYSPLSELAKNSDKPITAQWLLDAVVATRNSRLPDPAKEPNVGSFFKNPVITQSHYRQLKTQFPSLVAYHTDTDTVKLAAAWLIDNRGWRGREVKGVRVHTHQALVLTNPENKPIGVVLSLAKAIKEDVKKVYGIALEQEPQLFSPESC